MKACFDIRSRTNRPREEPILPRCTSEGHQPQRQPRLPQPLPAPPAQDNPGRVHHRDCSRIGKKVSIKISAQPKHPSGRRWPGQIGIAALAGQLFRNGGIRFSGMPLRKPLSTPVTVKGTFPDSTFHIGASLPIHLKAEAWISADKAIAASNMLRRNSVCRKHRLKATSAASPYISAIAVIRSWTAVGS